LDSLSKQYCLKIRPWLADFLALIGLGLYAAQMWQFAHLQFSVLDEGLYLYKGLLLATGQYTPFQDFGLWMNQMPLAYLMYGWAQMLFGAGLRTGRMFTFALGLLTALGLFLTARRLGENRWAAALLLWALALNPAALRMSAMAASQGLTACLLAWTFFFSLGADRRPWHLFFGGLLAGATVMVRINLILLLPLLLMYVWRANVRGLPALLAGMLISFGGPHLLYWPIFCGCGSNGCRCPFFPAFFRRPTPPPGIQILRWATAWRVYFWPFATISPRCLARWRPGCFLMGKIGAKKSFFYPFFCSLLSFCTPGPRLAMITACSVLPLTPRFTPERACCWRR